MSRSIARELYDGAASRWGDASPIRPHRFTPVLIVLLTTWLSGCNSYRNAATVGSPRELAHWVDGSHGFVAPAMYNKTDFACRVTGYVGSSAQWHYFGIEEWGKAGGYWGPYFDYVRLPRDLGRIPQIIAPSSDSVHWRSFQPDPRWFEGRPPRDPAWLGVIENEPFDPVSVIDPDQYGWCPPGFPDWPELRWAHVAADRDDLRRRLEPLNERFSRFMGSAAGYHYIAHFDSQSARDQFVRIAAQVGDLAQDQPLTRDSSAWLQFTCADRNDVQILGTLSPFPKEQLYKMEAMKRKWRKWRWTDDSERTGTN